MKKYGPSIRLSRRKITSPYTSGKLTDKLYDEVMAVVQTIENGGKLILNPYTAEDGTDVLYLRAISAEDVKKYEEQFTPKEAPVNAESL